jgi:hypothetical protein
MKSVRGNESAREMNWLLKLLGYRDLKYRGNDFSVRIKTTVREGVSVLYMREGMSLNLSGERIGRKWEGIEMHIPPEVGAGQTPQIVRDLETAFGAMRYGYVIARKTGIEVVPEAERQAAAAELSEMGYDIEILPDGKIRQTPREGAPRLNIEPLRKQAPRMMSLIQALHGTRPRFEILAKSKEF